MNILSQKSFRAASGYDGHYLSDIFKRIAVILKQMVYLLRFRLAMRSMRVWGTILFLLICVNGCKKESISSSQDPKQLIIGKWFTFSHLSRLYYSGVAVDSTFKQNFTVSDFSQYFSDGTGIQSANNQPAPSLSLFRYTINGSNLNQFNSSDNSSIAEVITKLTATDLWLNYTLIIPDPGSGKIYTEKDYIELKK